MKSPNGATPILDSKDNTKQIGWRVETRDFAFDAIQHSDESINTYVEWGDDQPGDMGSHATWDDVLVWLDALLQASRR